MMKGKAGRSLKAERVMASARLLFLKNGYRGTSMDDVAASAGVSKPTVYSHFKDKRGLFAAFIQAEIEVVAESLLTYDANGLSVRGGLERIGRAYLDVVLSPRARALFRLVVAECEAFPEVGAVFYEATLARGSTLIGRWLTVWIDQGALEIDDLTLAARRFLGLCRSDFHIQNLLGIDPVVPDAELDAHIKMVVTAFLAVYGARRQGTVEPPSPGHAA